MLISIISSASWTSQALVGKTSSNPQEQANTESFATAGNFNTHEYKDSQNFSIVMDVNKNHPPRPPQVCKRL